MEFVGKPIFPDQSLGIRGQANFTSLGEIRGQANFDQSWWNSWASQFRTSLGGIRGQANFDQSWWNSWASQF